METLVISGPLVERVTQLATLHHRTVEEIVESALLSYLDEQSDMSDDPDTLGIMDHMGALRAHYLGEYVAISQGKVIDHDHDIMALDARVHERYGSVPVTFWQVSTEPKRDLRLPMPRLERR